MADSLSWLDEINGERALEWVREQNARTAKKLGSGSRFQLNYERARVVHLEQNPMPFARPSLMHEGWLYDLMVDSAHPRGLWRRTELQSLLKGSVEWQPLIDVTALAKLEGRPLGLILPVHCFKKRCLVKMQGAGGSASRTSDLREFDLETRSFVKDGFSRPPFVNYAVWKNTDTLLLADSFGAETLTRRQMPISLREWSRAGHPEKEIFRGDPDGSWGVIPYARPSTSGEHLLTFSSFDRDRSRSYLVERDGRIVPTLLPDGITILGEYRGEVIAQLFSDEDWIVGRMMVRSGSLVSIPRAEIGQAVPAVRIVFEPRERESIGGGGVAITRDGLLVATYDNVRGRLSRFTLDGTRWIRNQIAFPDHGSVSLIASDPASSVALVTYESFIQPATLYAVDVGREETRPLMHAPVQFDATSLLVEQHEAVSKDGTRVPYFLVRPRAHELNGQTPTLLYGYGALGGSRTPHYDGALGRLWLEGGGAFALANIRGGSEFGPRWHVRRMERQRTYEDFTAVAEDLIRRKVTSPRKLGIRGHSNGGLLVGVMLNTRPELFNAAVIEHPVLDLRVHTRGLDSTEYGAWSDPEERAFLESTSPLQNLRKRTPFPVPLLKTATDDSVLPSPARRYAAKLAAFGMPYYFHESSGGRHSQWETPQDAVHYEALLYTYLAGQLM